MEILSPSKTATAGSRWPGCLLLFAFCAQIVFVEGAFAGVADKTEPLTVVLSAQKIIKSKDGKESYDKANQVKPGDVVEYRALYNNRGSEVLSGINASIPVPVGMTYIGKSAKPAGAEVSVGGGKFAPEPLMRTVKNADGKDQLVIVPLSEYRNLRWTLDSLESGKKFEVRARMQVNAPPNTKPQTVTKPTQ